MVKIIEEYNKIDEEHRILDIDFIKNIAVDVLNKFNIKTCYLFGSYAKGIAKGDSDIDLLIDSEITGLDYFGLIEKLREKLHKEIDLIRLKDVDNNELLKEIIKDGIKIYC